MRLLWGGGGGGINRKDPHETFESVQKLFENMIWEA